MKYIIAAIATILLLNGPTAKAQNPGSGLCVYPAAPVPLGPSTCWPANINGQTYTVKASSITAQAVNGPVSSVVGNVPLFNNITGTLLKDSGFQAVFYVPDTVALVAKPVIGQPLQTFVRVGTYNATRAVRSPPVDYYLTNVACTPDAGSCFAGATSGYYWHITPQTTYDPRWWGAYGDVVSVQNALTVTGGATTFTVAGANCTSAYAGASIVFTEITSATGVTPAKSSYQGTIASCSGTSFTVSSAVNVDFSSSITQYVRYGHVDDAALQAWLNFLGTVKGTNADYVPGNFAGLDYGVTTPLNPVSGVAYSNGSFLALGSTNYNSTNGVFNNALSNTTWSNIFIDLDFLPINGWYDTANGITPLQNVQARHWYSSFPGPVTASITGTSAGATATTPGTITSLTAMMIARNSAGAGVPDRTVLMPTRISGGNTILTFSRPLTSSPSGTPVTFYNEPAGFVVATGGGIHGILVTANEFDGNDTEHVNSGDNYGYEMLYGGNQSDFWHFTGLGGAVGVGIGPTTVNGIDFVESHVFNTLYNSAELDPPAVLIADPSNPQVVLDHFHENGAIQFFFVNNAVASMEVKSLEAGSSTNSTLTNNAVVQLISVQTTAINTSTLRADAFQSVSGGQISYDLRGFGACGTDWSFSLYTCTEIASIRHTISGDMLLPRRNLSINNLSLLSNSGGSSTLCDSAAPVILSGFGGTVVLTSQNGTCSFRITVTTGGIDTGGIVSFQNSSLTNWNCEARNMTTQTMALTQVPGSNDTPAKAQFRTVQYTTGSPVNLNAGDILAFNCFGE